MSGGDQFAGFWHQVGYRPTFTGKFAVFRLLTGTAENARTITNGADAALIALVLALFKLLVENRFN
ncbi:hypothetical protein [Paenibacillus sp. NPDC058174]|uniref:hypothetical protein n=1 Tax=Paenibacillus sp. NPDC058174 TaxID=3346366 RepID=UPI0036DC3435